MLGQSGITQILDAVGGCGGKVGGEKAGEKKR